MFSMLLDNFLEQFICGLYETNHEFSRLVLETLEPLPGDRKCFRMINGVLVERTVQDVLPQLKTNADGLKKVLDDLLKQYTTKQEELEKWKVCWTSRCPDVKQYAKSMSASEQDSGRHPMRLPVASLQHSSPQQVGNLPLTPPTAGQDQQ